MKYIFSAILLIIAILISISLLPPPLTSNAGILTTTIALSQIQNSCIVNNTNIAVQNENDTPIDATNNWWGMPKGASDQNHAGGDWVGWNIISQPHLTIIPPNCDLSVANWIPFNEQELQFAINANLPYLNGLNFALVDIQKGIGAKFTLVAKPIYGGATGEAYITITPSPDGSFMRIMLDVSQLPSNENLSKIATCELMPLFMNSLQQVQNKFTQPSQLIEQMVVMDSSLMMLFSAPTEITPESAPEIVMNYDSSCLLSLATATPTPTPTPAPTQDESEFLIQIPPMEGEIGLMENNITLTQNSIIAGTPDPCEPNEGGWCAFLQLGDVFTSNIEYNKLTSINHTPAGIVQFDHILPSNMSYPAFPSWGKVPNAPNHYRLTFACNIADDDTPSTRACYWDTDSNTFGYLTTEANYTTYSSPHIAPDGSKIAYIATISDGTTYLNDLIIYNFQTQTNSIALSFSTAMYPVQVKWGSSELLYYSTNSSTTTALWVYNVNTNTSTQVGLGEDVDFVPNLFDIQATNMFYWSYGNDNNYNLNSFGIDIWTLSFPSITSSYPRYYPFPVYWSPRVGSQANDNQAIMLLPSVNSDWCITRFDVTTIDEEGGVIDTGLCLESDSYSDWANGIDLSALNNQPPPTPTPTPPLQFTCLNPDPNATTTDKINLCITELAQYGISADATGLTPAWASQASFAQAWTLEELQGIMAGVENTAKAFFMLKYSGQTFDKVVARTLFNTVMGNFSVLRVKMNAGMYFMIDSDGDGDGDECVNKSFSACTANYAQVITFYDTIFTNFSQGTQGISEYLIVHEMGHRFNARSDDGGGRTELSLYGRFDDANTDDLYDYGTDKKRLVMGVTVTDDNGVIYANWVRGNRGWGTGPGAPFNYSGYLPISSICRTQTCRDQTEYITDFQQNSFSIGDGDLVATNQDKESEIDEAITDMFLNWVYFKSTNGSSGFKNWTWIYIPEVVNPDCTAAITGTVGCTDNSRSGEARFDRMETAMTNIFNNRGW